MLPTDQSYKISNCYELYASDIAILNLSNYAVILNVYKDKVKYLKRTHLSKYNVIFTTAQ